MFPKLWTPPPSEFPKLEYLCYRLLHKKRKRLSKQLEHLPPRLRNNFEIFKQKKNEIKMKLHNLQKRIDETEDCYLLLIAKTQFLCSIKLSKVYKELYKMIESEKLTGVILASPDEGIIKSLLYTADGTT